MRPKLLAGACILGAAILAGCGVGYDDYYSQYGPPPPRYGAVGYAPGPGYVWTSGWWDWHGHDWRWREGRWMRPPRRGASYVAPEWRHEGRGYRFHRGYWR